MISNDKHTLYLHFIAFCAIARLILIRNSRMRCRGSASILKYAATIHLISVRSIVLIFACEA